ncbi:DNA polymerase III subunit delta [Parapedobacter sp. SGR-10]|uniref:DNA polymerase III subunit delta n=1 Tax=Parapedobacter sp. SGR-10 TaxID=2710879 RepID=UPI0013D6E130|nr:DNA polymerase III subunit delta [Parapedobacter sp. SGR-10]NGF56908.1 DNA polymerase III subunit delta [Parapedobacter sp. SGR-10]
MNVNSILSDIKQRKFKPLYLLHGEEAYYIDLISDRIEHTVLQEAQKGFDQTVLYGKDTDISTIINAAKRYPMMSDYQVILVKEAQNLKWKAEDELFTRYVENPTPTTILVLAYKHGKFDKRTKLYKQIDKIGVAFESEKLYENKIGAWITEEVQREGGRIHPQAAALMAEYLGTDLSKVANEVQKLLLNVSREQEISLKDVEDNIGISKDFNVFELNNALGKRDAVKAFQIVDYFEANPKNNPFVVVLGSLGGYFTKILKYHYLGDKSSQSVARALGVSPFFTKDYDMAARNFNKRKTFDVLAVLREYDLKSKGMHVGPLATHGDLMREMVFKILN